MLASSSRISLKRVHTHVLSSSRRTLHPSAQLPNYSQRKHASTAPQEEESEESIPSPHLTASRERITGFSGDTDAQQNLTRTSIARFNMQLMEAGEMGQYSRVFDLAAQMKAQNIRPNVTTYSSLLDAAARHRMWLDGWAILDDMITMGLNPNVAVFNALIKAQNACTSDYLWQVLKKMDELHVMPNATTFRLIIVRLTSNDNMELAIQFYHAMKTYKIVPDIVTSKALVIYVARAGYPRLALDLIDDIEIHSLRPLDHTFFMPCLIASAEALYLDGVVTCWNKISQFGLHPGEGICLAVLDTAARNGHPELALDVFRVFQEIGVELQEHHFPPAIEALCRQMRLKEVIYLLDFMRTKEIEPTPETCSPLLEALNTTEAIDSLWAIIDELLKEGQKIDSIILQVLISASAKLGDLQRAIGAYKSLGEYGATANVTIFNSLLRGCVIASHRDLGNLLLADMKAIKVAPDENTFETFIILCLTQDDYEDAFFYLEEMKAAGFKPGYTVYSKLVRKCLSTDDFRYKIALKEMEQMGHEPRSDLKKLVRRKEEGKGVGDEEMQESSFDMTSQEESASFDGAARRFIETGGIEGAAQLPKEHGQ